MTDEEFNAMVIDCYCKHTPICKEPCEEALDDYGWWYALSYD